MEQRTEAVRVHRDLSVAHPAVRTLLEKDEQLREKQRQYSWYAPVFDTPLQKRRLRVLNAILLAVSAQGLGGYTNGEKAEETTVSIGRSDLGLLLEAIPERRRAAGEIETPKRERLRLSLKASRHDGAAQVLAEDEPDRPIEDRLRAIVINLIVTGEERYRSEMLQFHNWELERRRQLIEEAMTCA